MVSTPMAPEVIGDPACPILHRWTLLPPFWGKKVHSARHDGWVPDWLPKLLLHHFLPNADERHSHDHPRGFWTFVFKGGYDDMMLCPNEHCENGYIRGSGINHIGPREEDIITYSTLDVCMTCQGAGVVLRERMRAPVLRYRPATHIHRTRVHADGSWSLVLMGPMVREWGFWIDKEWFMEFKQYKKRYGYGMRCN